MRYFELESLTDEQMELKRTAHKFAKEVIRPASIKLDALSPEDVIKKDSVLWDVMRQEQELGYLISGIPEKYGGPGLSAMDRAIIFEELAWGSKGINVALGLTNFPTLFSCMFGHEELIKNFVEPYVNDTDASFIGCWALTEPDHGSDHLLPGTPYFNDPKITANVRARKVGDSWVLNGQKASWITNGPVATHAVLFVSIDPSKGMAGGGIAIMPLDLPGVTKGKPLDKLGMREEPQGEIFFDNVHIPDWCMVTDPETYLPMMEKTLSYANAGTALTQVGLARAAFEEALEYSKVRVQGGKLLCEHQLVHKKLFDMFVKVETSRAMARKVFVALNSDRPPTVEYANAAKVYVTQASFEIANEAVQLFGGCGISKEYLIEKLFRDARMMLIGDGSNDVLCLGAAQNILKNYGK